MAAPVAVDPAALVDSTAAGWRSAAAEAVEARRTSAKPGARSRTASSSRAGVAAAISEEGASGARQPAGAGREGLVGARRPGVEWAAPVVAPVRLEREATPIAAAAEGEAAAITAAAVAGAAAAEEAAAPLTRSRRPPVCPCRREPGRETARWSSHGEGALRNRGAPRRRLRRADHFVRRGTHRRLGSRQERRRDRARHRPRRHRPR